MGLVDKLKNIFFEEEEEEEVEDTRPIQKVKEKEVKKEKEVIAKKVEIPRRRKENEDDDGEIVEEIKFEVPKKEKEVTSYVEIPKEEPPKRESKITEMIFEDEDFILDTPKEEPKKVEQPFKTRESRETYVEKEIRDVPRYDYPKKEEPKKVGGFTPSPIISPIYGILDKNYKKEEVKENKEIRITSRVSRMDLDSVRNKAFGDLENELFSRDSDTPKEEDEEPKEDLSKLRDKIEDDGKPVIDKVTLGEADEYYTDLGLAYNTDYKDVSKEINDGKVKKEKKEKGDKLEDNLFDLIETMYDRED